MAQSNTTIADVAQHAGVSHATVSRVMNGNPTVATELAERVRASVKTLNYTASPLARSLAIGKTQIVSVVVPDLSNPTFQEILRGLSRAAARDGYHVLIADSAEIVAEERLLATVMRRRTDGIILCAPRMDESELIPLLGELEPIVLVNREPRAEVPVVVADYRSALLDVLDHLYGLGHRRLAYLAGVPRSESNANRLTAVHDFQRLHDDVEISEIPCGVGFENGYAAAAEVLAAGPTAVLAFNDLVAMGLMNAVLERGARVPEDLSITGMDDIPFARYTSPPLTTASVPADELGEQAWNALSRLLSGQDAVHPLHLRPRLIVRGSTGVPRSM